VSFGTSPKGNPQVIFPIEDACCPGHRCHITMTQYDPSIDILGGLLKRNNLYHTDDLTNHYVKIVLLVRSVKRKNLFLYDARSMEVLHDHNEITHHVTKVVLSYCAR
jgi:hypothetical protein